MTALSMIYLCTSQLHTGTWSMVPLSMSVVADSVMKGKKMSIENSVFKKSTGMTALPRNACFLLTS